MCIVGCICIKETDKLYVYVPRKVNNYIIEDAHTIAKNKIIWLCASRPSNKSPEVILESLFSVLNNYEK